MIGFVLSIVNPKDLDAIIITNAKLNNMMKNAERLG